MRRRRPSYARRWLAVRPAGSVRILVGKRAWQRARDRYLPVLIIPLDIDPNTLDFSFLRGRDSVLIQAGECPRDRLQQVAEAIVRAGVTPVVVLPEPDRRVVVFRHG